MGDPLSAGLLGALVDWAEPPGDLPRSLGDGLDPGVGRWVDSGAMALTGWPAHPLVAPVALCQAISRFGPLLARTSARVGRTVEVDPFTVLVERAALGGLRRAGQRSCGGASALLRVADGWIAVSLPRARDLEALPAWLAAAGANGGATSPEPWGSAEDPWAALATAAARRPRAALGAAAHLLGLPVGILGARPDGPATVATPWPGAVDDRPLPGARVLDLTALWAGPLCANLLGLCGADVVKVESTSRPDGARSGPRAFFDLLHGGHRSVALDLATAEGRRQLVALASQADVVLEASRPRALTQLGLDRDALAASGQPRVWVTITAHGAAGPAGAQVGFGDDAAVGGGLVAWDAGAPCFCADAVADPLTGLTATLGVLAAWRSGRRWHLDVALTRVAGVLARAAGPSGSGWHRDEGARALSPDPPRARTVLGPAPELGAHTAAVLAEAERRPAGGR